MLNKPNHILLHTIHIKNHFFDFFFLFRSSSKPKLIEGKIHSSLHYLKVTFSSMKGLDIL